MRLLVLLASAALLALPAAASVPPAAPAPSPWPAVATLPGGERIRITRVDAVDVVFDRLGSEPTEDEPETVTAPAQGVPAAGLVDLLSPTAVAAHIAAKLAEPMPQPVPAEVGSGQIRAGMIALGYAADMDALDALIAAQLAAIEDATQRAVAVALWRHATVFRREHTVISQVAAALEKSPADIDALFRLAATF